MCVFRGGLYIGPDPTVPPPLVNSNLSNSHGKVADERPRNPKPPSPGRLNYPSDQPLLLLSEKNLDLRMITKWPKFCILRILDSLFWGSIVLHSTCSWWNWLCITEMIDRVNILVGENQTFSIEWFSIWKKLILFVDL